MLDSGAEGPGSNRSRDAVAGRSPLKDCERNCSQPAGDVSHKPGGRMPLLSARSAVTLATVKRAATNLEQRHDGCEQFA